MGVPLQKRFTWDELTKRTAMKSEVPPVEFEKFRAWMQQKEHLGYVFDPFLYRRAFNVQQSLTKDYDHFTVIAGLEGTGKSFCSALYCSVVSPTFKITSICFTVQSFLEQLQHAQVGDSFQLDEGAMFLFSRDSLGGDNKKMIKLFTLFRQKSLHISICVPNFFIIDSYVRDHRVNTLIQLNGRGKYTGYTGDAIKKISKEGVKNKNVSSVKVPYGESWRGYWANKFPTQNGMSLEEYKTHKANHLSEFMKDLRGEYTANGVDKREYLSIPKVSQLHGYSESFWRERVKSGEIKGQRLGTKFLIDAFELKKWLKARESKHLKRIPKVTYN